MKSENISKEQDVLRKIVKASDAIRRKHKMLKTGREANEQAMQEVFKPLVNPLEILANASHTAKNRDTTTLVKKEIKDEIKNEIKDEIKEERNYEAANNIVDRAGTSTVEKLKHDDGDDEQDASFKSAYGGDAEYISSDDDNGIAETNVEVDDLINEYLTLLQSNRISDLDISYGVRNLANDRLMIGDSAINFESTSIQIGGVSYGKTIGLIELLFKKQPDASRISADDMKNYRDIIIATNAHKKYYKASGAIRVNNTFKFTNYIAKILSDAGYTGKGMPQYKVAQKDVKLDYVYWDDPNELVNRLRLLLASRAAGNSSHGNEIMSIIEELREAQIIY